LNKKADVLAVGPGISCNPDISELLKTILLYASVPMVLDADAINSISGHTEVFSRVKAPVVLTPHTGEMARLLQKEHLKDKPQLLTGTSQKKN
jgi:NAD(P)H-hydrate epimerase